MHIVVTAGPTREAIDPVRFISNHSSGKMGFAVAAAAVQRGHRVTLITGPVSLDTPPDVSRVDVVSAAEMAAAVLAALPACDALVMSAAVADWRPATVSDRKLKKRDMAASIALERTADILLLVKEQRGDQVVVGFAAETGDPTHEARRKLEGKGLDLIVANDIAEPGAGFGVDTNRVSIISSEAVELLPLQSKLAIGDHLVTRIERISECRHRP